MKMKPPDVKDKQPISRNAGHYPLVPAFIKSLGSLLVMTLHAPDDDNMLSRFGQLRKLLLILLSVLVSCQWQW